MEPGVCSARPSQALVSDPETEPRYTVKRYGSEKENEGESWRHKRIILSPVNVDFEPIVLTDSADASDA